MIVPSPGESPPDLRDPAEAVPSGTEAFLKRIQEYVWARYVNHETPPSALDEDQALAFLESHYTQQPMAEDAECFYYGILAFERSFAMPEQRPLLERALEAFRAYRQQTSPGFAWDAVDDRYQEILDVLGLAAGAAH